MPAAAQAHRGIAGGEIERPGDGSAPVDEQRGAFRVVQPHSDSPDVMGDAVIEIDTAETESGLHGIQRGEGAGVLGDPDVPLHHGLPTRADLPDRRPHGGFGLLPERVETLVDERDELLFAPQFLG